MISITISLPLECLTAQVSTQEIFRQSSSSSVNHSQYWQLSLSTSLSTVDTVILLKTCCFFTLSMILRISLHYHLAAELQCIMLHATAVLCVMMMISNMQSDICLETEQDHCTPCTPHHCTPLYKPALYTLYILLLSTENHLSSVKESVVCQTKFKRCFQ